MADQQPNTPVSPDLMEPPDQRPDPHVMDYLLLVARHKWVMLSLFFLTGGAFLGATYLVPQSYQAMALILPPDRASAAGMLSNLVEGSALSILKQVENPSVDLLQNLLESRSMAERLAADSLIHRFFAPRANNHDQLIASIHEAVKIRPSITKMTIDGIVWTGWNSTTAEKETARQLSARIANLAVATMDSIFKSEFRVSSHTARLNAESDLVARSAELDSLDRVQEEFERSHGVIAIKAQTMEAVSQLAKLEAYRDESRMKLALLGKEYSSTDTRYRGALAESEEADRAAREFAVRENVGPSLSELPKVSREYVEIVRRKTLLEPIVSYLRLVTEQERMNEEKEKSLITVLDYARPPDARFSPKRLPTLQLGLSVGLALGILYLGFIALSSSWKEESDRRGLLRTSSGFATASSRGREQASGHAGEISTGLLS